MPNIDPVATMKAGMIAAEMGAETLDDLATEFNGSSGKTNRAKLAREFKELPAAPWGKAAEKKASLDDEPSGDDKDNGSKKDKSK